MNSVSGSMSFVILGWLSLYVFVVQQTLRNGSMTVGLPLAYFIGTTFLYCGAFIYVIGGYHHLRADGSAYLAGYRFTDETVLHGAQTSLLGMLGLVVGFFLVTKLYKEKRIKGRFALSVRRLQVMTSLGTLGVVGFTLGLVNIPIPMGQALRQVGQNAAVVFVCLGAFLTVYIDGSKNILKWIVAVLAIIAAYLLIWGFVSYGFEVLTICGAFWVAVLAKRRLTTMSVVTGSVVILYALVTIFITYMSARDQLRSVLWSDNTSIEQRFDSVLQAFSRTEFFSPFNYNSLDLLNTRLNQSIFVGKVIEKHEQEPDLRLYGETLYYIPISWIPRFIWTSKPELGGSQFMSTHTGMTLNKDTTFGTGPFIEMFVNFGYLGVFFGCIILGILLRFVDLLAYKFLNRGDILTFAKWFLIGVAFMSPLRQLFFVANTVFASWIVMLVVESYLNRTGAPVGYERQTNVSVRDVR